MPAAHYLHPDFGLLCPTPRFRRKVRMVVGCLVVALIGGTVLRVIHSPPRAPTDFDTTAAVGDAGEVSAMMLAAPPGKARKPRVVRAATNPPALAAIALGRRGAVWGDGKGPARGVSWRFGGKAGRSRVSPPAIAAAEASQSSAAMSKKAKKVARRENRRALWWREVRADPWGVGYGG